MAAARGTSGSYYEDYMRSNALLKHGGDRNAKQLLTDRNAYISFLEVQLERVSAACLSAQTVEKRLAELEAAQLASDQKISSLSKVFRLNQEYMEQTAEQSRAELTAFASKMDSWMEKYSTQLQTHEARLTDSEEHMRHTDSFVETLSCEVRQDLESLKATVESETHDLKTLVFAVETRVETMQTAQGDADQYMDILRQLVTDRLDEDLERIRNSLSEKFITIEEQHEELRTNVKMFANEIEAGWKTDLARMARSDEEKWKRMRDQVQSHDQSMIVEIHEVKEFLRKCLDAQHLLSATVVGLQAEVDDKKYAEVAKQSSNGLSESAWDEIDELRKNQLRLKEAVRVVQTCSRDAQQSAEARFERLSDRLDTAEQQFASLAQESLIKADEMRTKVLVALGEVEQNLRHDADAVAENAAQSVRAESQAYINQFLEIVSRLEQRVDELEHQSDRIHVNIPTVSRTETPRHSAKEDNGSSHDITKITEAVTKALEKQLSSIIGAVRTEAARTHAIDADLKSDRMLDEDRLNMSALRTEERNALLSKRDPNERKAGVRARRSLHAHQSAPSESYSSSSTSVYGQPRKVSLPKKVKTLASRGGSVKELKNTASASNGKAKNNRLKEVCLDIVALEGSLKSRRRGVVKSG